ncbi:MAG: hypothetical protein ACRDG8_01090 [Actinomycetota bacterium]
MPPSRVDPSASRLPPAPALDEVLDLESGVAEEPDHVAVGDRELHRAIRIGPLEPVHAEEVASQLLAGREVLLGERQHREGGMPEEDQPSAGLQDPRRL